MLYQFLLIFGCFIFATSGLSGLQNFNDEVLNDAERYRQLRLEHMRRHRRQQPKEVTIQVTAPLFSSRLFDYGTDAGDKELPAGLDAGLEVKLQNPLRFNGDEHQSVYVLSNGGIGFDYNSRSYRSNVFSKDANSIPLIAPFWNRNDLRNGGHVWYREITGGRIIERGQSEIRYQYDKTVKVLSCLLVTWEKMQPLGSQILPDENTNSFQAAFFMTANHTYANFIYSNIGWTQGAEAGFSTGPNGNDFSLPTSGTANIMYLEEYGNTGIPGEWMFELQPQRVVRCKAGFKGDTCDEVCAHGEYGEDCAQCCHCAGKESCNAITGQCPNDTCAECYFGPTCRSKTNECNEKDKNSCARNAIGYFATNKCGEQVAECNCLQGYTGDGRVECVDIDECQQPGTCHENAICTNTPGHFFCECAEGFTGDGVTECVASFLYPHEGHEKIKPNTKALYKFSSPLVIFGESRDRFYVTSNGLIIVQEMNKVRSDDTLESMNILGVAPFFGPIDLTKSGAITVGETASSEVLARASQQINENLEQPIFIATNLVTVTYMNVSTEHSRSPNTFQAVIVGGRSKRGDEQTYVMLLYKNLIWSEGAEAGIMTAEKSNSIHLPGSGREGIEQLSQLSNIKSPGIWVYRIDQDIVFPCMQLDLQPPYCDAQSPTLVNNPHLTPSTPKQNIKVNNGQRQDNEPFTKETVAPLPPRIQNPFTSGELPSSSRTWPSTQRQSTQHRPVVSIHPDEFTNLPDDAFETTGGAPFVTNIPKIFESVESPSTEVEETVAPSSLPPTQPLPPTAPVRIPAFIETSEPSSSSVSQSTPLIPEEVQNPIKPERPQIDFVDTEENNIIEFSQPVQTIIPFTVPSIRSSSKVPIPVIVDPLPTQPRQFSISRSTTVPPTEETENSTPLRIFPTTTKPTKATSKRPKIVIGTTPIPTTADNSNVEYIPYNPNEVLESSAATKTPILIITAIIVVWLVLLIVIALGVCCKRRRERNNYNATFGQSYGIRPIATGYAMRKGSKGFDVSYEDHMEKAARLSSEMNSYNPRYSYGARY